MEEVDGFFPPPGKSQTKLINTNGKSEEQLLAEVIGNSEFGSTKGMQVIGNESGESAYRKQRQYKQVLRVRKLYDVPLTRQQLEEKNNANLDK